MSHLAPKFAKWTGVIGDHVLRLFKSSQIPNHLRTIVRLNEINDMRYSPIAPVYGSVDFCGNLLSTMPECRQLRRAQRVSDGTQAVTSSRDGNSWQFAWHDLRGAIIEGRTPAAQTGAQV
jgi:hypothetical protein